MLTDILLQQWPEQILVGGLCINYAVYPDVFYLSFFNTVTWRPNKWP